MNDQFYVIEIMLGLIIIPWCVFVTASIFGLKQQYAVLKMEMSLLREIKDILKGVSDDSQ